MKPNIWIFSLEPLDSRYTAQWYDHIPSLLKKVSDKYNIVQIDGTQKQSEVTRGAFLNFSDTNYWKSSQLCNFLEKFNQKLVTNQDHFVFTDAWNPVILQIKYMNDLLGNDWTMHGFWHAGSYDPQDFLGRLVGNAAWVRHSEKSFFHALDHNYFATDFHINMFLENLLDLDIRTGRIRFMQNKTIVRSGWPMEYMVELLHNYKNKPKRDLILFPHRLAPEKQIDIFKDLQTQLPQYEFITCQETKLTKNEYHSLLSESKIVFSANLQETLGISCYEGCLVDSIPMVPDRLSYTEMYRDDFKYPSHWTESWNQYLANRNQLCHHIVVTMTHYEKRLQTLRDQTQELTENFFSSKNFLENF